MYFSPISVKVAKHGRERACHQSAYIALKMLVVPTRSRYKGVNNMNNINTTFMGYEKSKLTNAFLDMAQFYHWTGRELSSLTGLSESTISRVNQGKRYLLPNSKEGEIVILLLKIFHYLNDSLGHHHQKAVSWLNSKHQAFNYQKPIDCMKNIVGLVTVARYLEQEVNKK